jgi:methanogenic corrinoid protein MtbC1
MRHDSKARTANDNPAASGSRGIDPLRHGIGPFASRVLTMVALRGQPAPGADCAALAMQLVEAALSAERGAIDDLVARLVRGGVARRMVTDELLPRAARDLGTAWEDDRLTFAEVTLAVSRLQHMLHAESDANQARAELQPGHGGSALVLVPPGEQHTLGAVLVAAQLRRRGVSVCLRFGPPPSELRHLLRSRQFDCAMVSVCRPEALDLCSHLVEMLHGAGERSLPVVIGGAAIASPAAEREAARMTGADLATSDPEAVLDRFVARPEEAEAQTA